jgi:ABC-type uncharacterized transport system substrate-binding protein
MVGRDLIVFVNVPDPVGAGFIESMAHLGGNITGFSNFEYSMGGKWAELLKQIAPNVTQYAQSGPASRGVYRSHPQGREAG